MRGETGDASARTAGREGWGSESLWVAGGGRGRVGVRWRWRDHELFFVDYYHCGGAGMGSGGERFISGLFKGGGKRRFKFICYCGRKHISIGWLIGR